MDNNFVGWVKNPKKNYYMILIKTRMLDMVVGFEMVYCNEVRAIDASLKFLNFLRKEKNVILYAECKEFYEEEFEKIESYLCS